jgi:hypothetical protein
VGMKGEMRPVTSYPDPGAWGVDGRPGQVDD